MTHFLSHGGKESISRFGKAVFGERCRGIDLAAMGAPCTVIMAN